MRMIPAHDAPGASRAERLIFEQLSAVDVPGWSYGFHSINLSEHERKRVCEIDFLLLGERGFLVLEVKGGSVRRTSGVWYSQDLRGTRHRLKESPLEQAGSAMFALAGKLRQMVGPELPNRTVFGYGAVFPDIDFDATTVEGDPAMVIDRQSLDTDGWAAALDRMGTFWENKPGRRSLLSADEVDQYLDHLRPDFDLVATLRQLSRAVEEELVSLTARQYRALDMYGRNPRLLFEGGAGTGKTMLAAELCRRAVGAGDRVLLTCRSTVLAGFLRSQPGLDAVSVLPFHRVADLADGVFDLVVVDEGQDLVNTNDLAELNRLLVGGLSDGRWVLLLDTNNQRGLVGSFEDAAMTRLRATRPTEVVLIDNCRNTRQIVTATQERTGADAGVAPAGTGVDVVSFEGSRASVADLFAAALDQLEVQHVPLEQVVLLSRHSLADSVFAIMPDRWRRRVDVLDVLQLRRPTAGRLGYARVADFKGLESPFVMLEASGEDPDTLRALLYVGMTRARTALWVATVTDAADRTE